MTGVLAEWDDVGAYLAPANQPGSRASTYRENSPTGRTVVCFLDPPGAPTVLDSHDGYEGSPAMASARLQRIRAAPPPTALLERIARFQRAVDELLPGRYVWLAPASLHVTLRSVDPEPAASASTADELANVRLT